MGKIKDLFFTSDAQTKDTVKVPEKTTNVVQTVNQPVQLQPFAVNANTVGTIDKDIYNSFIQTIQDSNLPGPDYIEVIKAADSFKDIIPDENSRLLSAYKATKAIAPELNKERLLNSISTYINVIESERSLFYEDLKNRVNTDIVSRQNEIQTRKAKIEEANKKIEEATEKIVALKEQIGVLSSEINTIDGEIQSNQTNLDIQKKNFDLTADLFISNLNTDKEKFGLIIKE